MTTDLAASTTVGYCFFAKSPEGIRGIAQVLGCIPRGG